MPRSLSEASRLPANVDDYLRDNFGLRRLALEIHNGLVWYILRDSPAVQLTRGQDGMIFYNAHSSRYPYSLIEQSCGIGLPAPAIAPVTDAVANFLRRARQLHPASTLVIIPTKAPIYPERLPQWLGERCRAAIPPTRIIEQQLSGEPQLAAMLGYPLDDMRSLKSSMAVYPLHAFHWAGEVPRLVAERIAERTFGLAKLRNFTALNIIGHSDLQRFVPGVDLRVEDLEPDYAASGVRACRGPACFLEIGELGRRLGDVSRFQSDGRSGPKFLLLTDSFGAAIAGWFSQYASEVRHFNINDLLNSSSDQREAAQFAKRMFFDFNPDYIVYLFHDGAVLYAPRELTKLLPNDLTRSP